MTEMTRRNFLTSSAFAFFALRTPARLFSAQQPSAQQPSAQQAPPTSAGPADPTLIEDLVAAYRILAQQGVVDGYGHVSARHNRNKNRFIMARALAPELVTAADLIEFDLDAVPVDAKGRALYSERFIHAEIFRARADVNAVVHAHAPSVIPFADTNVPMRPMNHMGSFMGSGVPVFDIRKNFGMTDMLVSDSKKGHALAEVLGNKNVALMRGHGVAVVGPTVHHVVGRSIYLEVNARMQAQALSFGSPITYLDPQEAQKMLDSGENGGYERPWAAWKAKAMGK